MDPVTAYHLLITWGPVIVTVASIIAAATPNKKDDKIVGTFRKIIDVLAINVGHAKK